MMFSPVNIRKLPLLYCVKSPHLTLILQPRTNDQIIKLVQTHVKNDWLGLNSYNILPLILPVVLWVCLM